MDKLLVSFSGGETSAYMAQWLWRYKQNEYEMIFVFANTGQENEETLIFIDRCTRYFGFPVVWIEANVSTINGKGTTHRIVTFETASRNGEPFEDVIAKYGIPNTQTPHCTRELKERPIKSYAKSIGWDEYFLSIGIRVDEADRINEKAKEKRFIYPLINKKFKPMTKPQINAWWSRQPFRLNLTGYQGNCKTCWKKSDKKLFQIAKEGKGAFDFFQKMEDKYKNYVPETRLAIMKEQGKKPKLPCHFFRGNRSVNDIIRGSQKAFDPPIDDSMPLRAPDQLEIWNEDLIGGESCEVFSECNS